MGHRSEAEQALVDRALAEVSENVAPQIRDQIIDRLMDMAMVDPGVTIENVRLDHGNIAFDLHVDGQPTITRIFGWGVGRYADGKP